MLAVALATILLGTTGSPPSISLVTIPTGLYTLERVTELISNSTNTYQVDSRERERVVVLRCVSLSSEDIASAVMTATGDLKLVVEKPVQGPIIHRLVADPDLRNKERMVATKVVSELRASLFGSLGDILPQSYSYLDKTHDERLQVSAGLGEERSYLREQIQKDPDNAKLRKQNRDRIRSIDVQTAAISTAESEWGPTGLEVLNFVKNRLPNDFKNTESWKVSLTGLPGADALMARLQKFFPKDSSVRDIVVDVTYYHTDDRIGYEPRVFAVLDDDMVRVPALCIGKIEREDCQRKTFVPHFEGTCEHAAKPDAYQAGPLALPPIASKEVNIRAGRELTNVSHAAIVWADASGANVVAELVPFADDLKASIPPQSLTSLKRIVEMTNRWSATDVSGVLVLTCNTRGVDSAAFPLSNSLESGILKIENPLDVLDLHWSIVRTYARSALKRKDMWSNRNREFSSMYYGVNVGELDHATILTGLLDGVSLSIADSPDLVGKYPLNTINAAKLGAVMNYMAGLSLRPTLMHPRIGEHVSKQQVFVRKRGDRLVIGLETITPVLQVRAFSSVMVKP